jgi:hypothetical protein
MTYKHDITKQYHTGRIVTVCMISADKFKKGEVKTLEHLIKGVVIDFKPPIKDYQFYSHGICKPCRKMYYGGI